MIDWIYLISFGLYTVFLWQSITISLIGRSFSSIIFPFAPEEAQTQQRGSCHLPQVRKQSPELSLANVRNRQTGASRETGDQDEWKLILFKSFWTSWQCLFETNITLAADKYETNSTKYFQDEEGSEALPVDDGRAGLVVLLLRDPHLLERGQRGEDGASDPDGVPRHFCFEIIRPSIKVAENCFRALTFSLVELLSWSSWWRERGWWAPSASCQRCRGTW